ncbi:MAG: Transcriptional regulator, Xre family, partial [uncultured Rubrobacteraceae bacterium]
RLRLLPRRDRTRREGSLFEGPREHRGRPRGGDKRAPRPHRLLARTRARRPGRKLAGRV